MTQAPDLIPKLGTFNPQPHPHLVSIGVHMIVAAKKKGLGLIVGVIRIIFASVWCSGSCL